MKQKDQLSQRGGALPPQACNFPLTNLKTHLIIRISKGQGVDGKRETKGGGYEDRLRVRRLGDRREQGKGKSSPRVHPPHPQRRTWYDALAHDSKAML